MKLHPEDEGRRNFKLIIWITEDLGFRQVGVMNVKLTLLSIKLPIWDTVKLHVNRSYGSTITPGPYCVARINTTFGRRDVILFGPDPYTGSQLARC
jgi:hypothetical protein